LGGIAAVEADAQRKREADAAEAHRKAEVKALREQLAQADKKSSLLLEQQTPRRLSDGQRKALIAALSPFAGQKFSIFCSFNGWDCGPFGHDFFDTLKAAKWSPTGPVGNGTTGERDLIGIEILVPPQMVAGEGHVVSPAVLALANTMVNLGLMPKDRAAISRWADYQVGVIQLQIGRALNPSP
jgi:hypothetical protein